MPKEKISIGGETHEIETRPITLIFKDSHIAEDVKYHGRLRITSQLCHEHVSSLVECHADTDGLVKMVFSGYKGWDADRIKGEGSGLRHVIGLVDLTLKCIDVGIPFAWVYPEATLHPRAQCDLGDVLIALMTRMNEQEAP